MVLAIALFLVLALAIRHNREINESPIPPSQRNINQLFVLQEQFNNQVIGFVKEVDSAETAYYNTDKSGYDLHIKRAKAYKDQVVRTDSLIKVLSKDLNHKHYITW